MATLLAKLRAISTAAPATTSIASPFRHVRALLWLCPLWAAFAMIMAWAPWHSNFDVDSFTRYLQVLAIAQHGSAGFPNGPVAESRALTPAWTFAAHGLAYGPYPVLCDAVLAIGAKLDGFRGIIRVTWLLFAQTCLFTYALTYRLTKRPAVAVVAAYALAVATSCAFWTTMVAPFVPAAAFGITAAYFLTRSYDPLASPRRAFALATLGGVFASLAVGSHLIGAAGFLLVPLACAWTSTGRGRIARPLAYVVGSAPGVTVMSWVNHVRFGSYNPFSYGPCDTWGCYSTLEANTQNGQIFLKAALPYAPYVVVVAVAGWLVWRTSRSVAVLVFFSLLAALVPSTPAGDLFRRMARTFYAGIVDTGSLEVGYLKWGDDPGVFQGFWFMNGGKLTGPWCVRSLLQCSPFLAAALLPISWTGPELPRPEASHHERRGAQGVLLASCVGVVLVLLMRAYLPGSSSIGSPMLNYRHVVPVVPAFTVLAFVVLAELPLRAWHLGVAVGVASVGIHFLSPQIGDDDPLRRQVTHWLPLGLSFVAWTATAAAFGGLRAPNRRRAAHAAALLAALAVGYGAAVTGGIDRTASKMIRGVLQQSAFEELQHCTPKRFVMAGAAAMQSGLGLLDQKEVVFVDVTMADSNLLGNLMSELITPGTPAFLMDEDPTMPWVLDWPEFAFEKLADPACPRIRRIVRVPIHDSPAPPREPDPDR